jgi:hypothetical protein
MIRVFLKDMRDSNNTQINYKVARIVILK